MGALGFEQLVGWNIPIPSTSELVEPSRACFLESAIDTPLERLHDNYRIIVAFL